MKPFNSDVLDSIFEDAEEVLPDYDIYTTKAGLSPRGDKQAFFP